MDFKLFGVAMLGFSLNRTFTLVQPFERNSLERGINMRSTKPSETLELHLPDVQFLT